MDPREGTAAFKDHKGTPTNGTGPRGTRGRAQGSQPLRLRVSRSTSVKRDTGHKGYQGRTKEPACM